jgi:rare lipoprotein A
MILMGLLLIVSRTKICMRLRKYLMMLLCVAGPVCYAQQEASTQSGKASYYANQFEGQRTSNGERFRLEGFTGAHRTLPFNTFVEVTNPGSKQSVVVRINDRGPFHRDRIVDLSTAAARAIGIFGRGVAEVTLRVLSNAEARLLGYNAGPIALNTAPPSVTEFQPTAVLLD